ncbi:rhamnogalacturonan acetylesterase [Formosa sp. S-31]|uniref:rhamnogalacturonan acetylesterase n=1 Tax=Formosa sp. S-31 TaxID=2790949 RepID=UPI003EBBABDD
MKLIKITLFHLLCSVSVFSQSHTKTFNFGTETSGKSGTSITKPIAYTDELGYGFDFNTAQYATLNEQSLTSNKGIYFSVKLPEGNYKIDLVLGANEASTTTVKAESRRLMLNEVTLKKHQTANKSFVVNVRTPKINSHSVITVKDREKDDLNWDDRLTLEFLGQPAVKSITITPVSSVTTVFLAGDSTVTDQDIEPWASWGQFITAYFNNSVSIANFANSGESLQSFKSRKRFEKILSIIQPGDYLLIEFGHNDEKIKGEGNGAWGLYTNLLKEFITECRAKKAIPVLLTPTQRRAFETNGTLKPTHGDFPNAMRQVAKDLDVPLIDLTKMTTVLYESWGDEISRKAFVQYPANTFPGQTKALEDNTHFNSFGANEIAKCVVKGIQDLKLPLKDALLQPLNYNPSHPDNYKNWTLPLSSRFENTKPDGN